MSTRPQDQITKFWSMVAPGYEDHGGNVAEHGTDGYRRWLDAVAPDVDPHSVDVVTNRHLLWTLREPETAMANWLRLLRPGGLVLSVDGFWFADEGSKDPDDPNVFDQHYSPETRAALPFMPLDDTGPIVETFARAGYSDVRAEYLPALTDPGAGATPYLVVARP